MMLRQILEILVTHCADRALHALVAGSTKLPVDGSASSGLSIVSCRFHEKCLFRRAS
jgi:hypothetical protein